MIKEIDIESISLKLYINQVWEDVILFYTIDDLIKHIYKIDNSLVNTIITKSRFVYQNYGTGNAFNKFELVYNNEKYDSIHIIFRYDIKFESVIDESTFHMMILKHIRLYKLNCLI